MLVRVRRVEQQRVLSLTREVKVGRIEEFIDDAADRLERLAPAAGSLFVVYHGEVTTTLANPVEVCLPIAPDAHPTLPPDVTDRVEPAHREAFVPVTKAGLEYPEILQAYAAVEAWVRTAGVEQTAPPREVYFGIFDQATMDDEVCRRGLPDQRLTRLGVPLAYARPGHFGFRFGRLRYFGRALVEPSRGRVLAHSPRGLEQPP